jgi:hypothetical protein
VVSQEGFCPMQLVMLLFDEVQEALLDKI